MTTNRPGTFHINSIFEIVNRVETWRQMYEKAVCMYFIHAYLPSFLLPFFFVSSSFSPSLSFVLSVLSILQCSFTLCLPSGMPELPRKFQPSFEIHCLEVYQFALRFLFCFCHCLILFLPQTSLICRIRIHWRLVRCRHYVSLTFKQNLQ